MNLSISLRLCLLAAACPTFAAAQTTTLMADRIIDGQGAVLANTVVVVEGARIARLGGPPTGAVYEAGH